MAKLKGNITICRNSDGDISIEIQDEESRIKFFHAKISPQELGEGLTGLACRPIEFELNKTENVGKRKVTRDIKLEMPKGDYGYGDEKRKEIETTGKGWIADLYLRSQNSFKTVGDREYVNTTMSYWE
jgi:hypothetical protein